MPLRAKLYVLEDVNTYDEKNEDTVVVVKKIKQSADAVFAGKPQYWSVTVKAAGQTRAQECNTLRLTSYLQKCDPAVILVPVLDMRQLLHLLLRPKVPIDLSESHFDYFERDAVMEYVLEGFLRDTNFPTGP